MKKGIINVISLVLMTFALTGCGKGIDIAFITDMGTVYDDSFNQGTYEGVVRFTEDTGKTCKIYEPDGVTNDEYMKNIKKAVKDGAEVIVCPGYLFEEAIYKAQKKYPKVEFILVDGQPHNADASDYTIEDNTMPIVFSEEQAGFLAGYAAVRDGNTDLGFMGGNCQDSVIRFGYGFVQGADYAAIEMGTNVSIRYCYANTFLENDDVKSMTSAWYKGGTQVIFACGGAMGKSVFAAAEETGGKAIGVDIDQSNVSESIITSAKKMLGNAVYQGLSNYYDDTFTGGTLYEMDAANDGIGLEMDNARFTSFTREEYDTIYARLVSGGIVPYNATDYGNTSDLELVSTEVYYMELKKNEE